MTEITHPLLDWLDQMIDKSSSDYESLTRSKKRFTRHDELRHERLMGRREMLLQCRDMAHRLVSQPVTMKHDEDDHD